VWSDHANFISVAYAGTPALKTDFTRTGKRTRQGAIEDFSKSAMRYLKNNYFDGPRQDAFDLFSGAFIPRRGPAMLMPLVTDGRPLMVRAVSGLEEVIGLVMDLILVTQMPYIAWYSLFMIFAGLTLPRTSRQSFTAASQLYSDTNLHPLHHLQTTRSSTISWSGRSSVSAQPPSSSYTGRSTSPGRG
jgi:hypothetical protein